MRDRKPTLELGQPIAIGRTAEVFAWGDGRVLKLLRPEMPASVGQAEARAARRITEVGLAAPRLIETIAVDGRFGLVYERVDGMSMLQALSAQPLRAGRMATDFARLHASMHDASGEGLPDVKENLRHMIGLAAEALPAVLRSAALERLERLPDGDAILHGDLHPGNVVMTASGPVAIDWIAASRGHPAADVARTLFLLREGAIPGETPRLQRLAIDAIRRWFARSYLRSYRRLRDVDPTLVHAWRPPMLAARLGEGIEEERDAVLTLLRRALAD